MPSVEASARNLQTFSQVRGSTMTPGVLTGKSAAKAEEPAVETGLRIST
jgi:hypothetical protein